ncbi:MAG: hypothetical protein M1409_08305 [Actinobacteria bacterium]|nr:hypothetical protein [Actinomycetota bacterium]
MIWVSIVGLFFNLIGSILLGKTVIKSDKEIDKISGTYWGSNADLAKSLKRDKIVGKLGICILIIGFVLQLAYVILREIIK